MRKRPRFSPATGKRTAKTKSTGIETGKLGLLSRSVLFNTIDRFPELNQASKDALKAAIANGETADVRFTQGTDLTLRDGEIIIPTDSAELRTQSPFNQNLLGGSEETMIEGSTFRVRSGTTLGEVGGLGIDPSLRTVGLLAENEFGAIRVPDFISKIREVQKRSRNREQKQAIELFILKLTSDALLTTTNRLHKADSLLVQILRSLPAETALKVEKILIGGKDNVLPRESQDLIKKLGPKVAFKFDPSGDKGFLVTKGSLRIKVGDRTLGRTYPGQIFGERLAVQEQSNHNRAITLPHGFEVTPKMGTVGVPFNIHDIESHADRTELTRAMLTGVARRQALLTGLATNLSVLPMPAADTPSLVAQSEVEETASLFKRFTNAILGDLSQLMGLETA